MVALGEKILQAYLASHQPSLIGVTGASGKALVVKAIAEAVGTIHPVRAVFPEGTSLQDVAAAILRATNSGNVSWWRAFIGTWHKEASPREPRSIVVECSASKPGEGAILARSLPFSHAVIINTGTMHADLFPSKEASAHELLSLAASLPRHRTAILNIDDPLIAANRPRLTCQVVTYGMHPQADIRLIRADRISIKGFIGQVAVAGKSYEFSVQNLVGRHQLDAVLAACAVTYSLGGDIAQALAALRTLPLPAGHMNIVEGRHGSTIIDDTHGATPESMHAALKTLAAVPADLHSAQGISPRKIAILGDIADLGSTSITAHQAIGESVARICHVFIAVGKAMKQAQAAALHKGGVDTHHFDTSADVGKWLESYLQPGDIVLIKGGSEMHMEKVVTALKN